jgi:hypothetical protein
LRDDLQFVARHFADVAGLHQQAAADALDVEGVVAGRLRVSMRSTRTLAFFFA